MAGFKAEDIDFGEPKAFNASEIQFTDEEQPETKPEARTAFGRAAQNLVQEENQSLNVSPSTVGQNIQNFVTNLKSPEGRMGIAKQTLPLLFSMAAPEVAEGATLAQELYGAGRTGLYAGAGAGVQNALTNAYRYMKGQPLETPGDIARNIGGTAAVNAAIPAAFSLAGRAFEKATPTLGQMVTVPTAVKPQYATNALRGGLEEAPTLAQASEGYKQIRANAGLPTDEILLSKYSAQINPETGSLMPGTEKILLTSSDYTRIAENGLRKLQTGTLNAEEAMATREALTKLRSMGKMGSEQERVNLTVISQKRDLIDDFLKGPQGVPGYVEQAKTWFDAKTRQAFSSFLPQNVNGSPNVLRTYTGVAGGVAAATSGRPLASLIPLVNSPLLVGGSIRLGRALATTAEEKIPGIAAYATNQLLNKSAYGPKTSTSSGVDRTPY